jgi:hypothetical protein
LGGFHEKGTHKVATDPSDKPAQAEGTTGRRSLLRRVPTALIVTLVGIALSAWLVPAITRQWDDRQKEHDLKAAVVTDMAAATARMITRSDEIRAGGRLSASERRDWSLAWLEMEARLNAYFPRPVVEAWLDYGYLVSYFDPTALSSARIMSGYEVASSFQDGELGDYRVRRHSSTSRT